MHRFRNWFDDEDFAGGRRGRPHGRPGGGPFGGPGGPGGGPWGGPFGAGGPGGPFGPGGGGGWLGALFGRGPRQRRGNVRFAILTLLAEQPHNGYQLIQAIEQRSHGTWRPSSGSIYPTLQLLEDEGLVAASDKAQTPGQGQSKTYALTDAGKKYVKEHEDELQADWDMAADASPWAGDPRVELMTTFKQLAVAATQVAATGTPEQIAEAKKMLADVRRQLYRMLAESPDHGDGDDE